MRQVKTFSVEYNWFAPGTVVTPTSNRSPLERGHHYTVTKCLEPKFAGDECVVFVEGREQGVSTNYLKAIDEQMPAFIHADRDIYFHRLHVARITNNPKEYPDCVEDSEEYPEIIEYVEDEMDLFIVDPETRNFWPAKEFFLMVGIRDFLVSVDELHDD